MNLEHLRKEAEQLMGDLLRCKTDDEKQEIKKRISDIDFILVYHEGGLKNGSRN